MSIAETRLEIRYRRIDDLKPDPRNPRQHTRKQIKQLARSIETFGFTVPALVDTIIRRWQKLFGNVARHAETCCAFDDLAREAEVAHAA